MLLTPLILVLLGSFSLSVYFVLSARLMRERRPEDSVFAHPGLVQGITSLLGGIALAVPLALSEARFQLPSPTEFASFWSIALICNVTSQLCQFSALARIDVAFVTSFAALAPVIAVFSGWHFLGETPDLPTCIGITVGVLGILGMNRGALLQRNNRVFTYGFFFAICSGVLPAFGQAAGKRAILSSGVLFYISATLVVCGLVGILVARVQGAAVSFAGKDTRRTVLPLLGLCLLRALGSFFLAHALVYTEVARVAGMARASVVFQVVLAYFLAGQREQFFSRLFWSAWVFAGVLVLSMQT